MSTARGFLPLAAAAILLVAGPAAAQGWEIPVTDRFSGTVTIGVEEWRAFVIRLAGSDTLGLSVVVTAGGPVDVYFLDQVSYSDYLSPNAPSFSYFVSGTREDTRSFSASVSSPGDGTFYTVVDNANTTQSGATAVAPVTVDVSLERRPFPIAIVAIGAVGVAAAIIIALVLWVRARRRRAPPAGPPPPFPPQSPPPEPPGPGPPTDR